MERVSGRFFLPIRTLIVCAIIECRVSWLLPSPRIELQVSRREASPIAQLLCAPSLLLSFFLEELCVLHNSAESLIYKPTRISFPLRPTRKLSNLLPRGKVSLIAVFQ